MWFVILLFFFFFQAEDGIRDHCVTGVQTCALPIFATRLPGFACRKRSSRRGNWRWHALRRRHLGNGRAGNGWHRNLLTLGLRMFTATTWAMSSALVQDEERTMLRSARILILSFLRERR